MRVRFSAVLIACVSALVLGCPPADKREPPAASQGCTSVGQSCEYSPGKLGTCVYKDDCKDAPAKCYVCQSQH